MLAAVGERKDRPQGQEQRRGESEREAPRPGAGRDDATEEGAALFSRGGHPQRREQQRSEGEGQERDRGLAG